MQIRIFQYEEKRGVKLTLSAGNIFVSSGGNKIFYPRKRIFSRERETHGCVLNGVVSKCLCTLNSRTIRSNHIPVIILLAYKLYARRQFGSACAIGYGRWGSLYTYLIP